MSATLSVQNLTVDYQARAGLLNRKPVGIRAVDGVSFEIEAGTTLGLVGESGSGKTSVARAILGLVPLTSGDIWLLGRNLAARDRSTRGVRRHVQMVFQQPTASLDPRMRAGDSISEPLVHLLGMRGTALSRRVGELLELVGLERTHADRFPRQLSGGQRQRVAIARAIATSPELVICDEPTSSVDVSVQAQIINLLVQLQCEIGISYLFISHDLGTVRQIADFVAVMHKGRIVEAGPPDAVFGNPTDPYTKALLDAVPTIDRIARGRPREHAFGHPGGSGSVDET